MNCVYGFINSLLGLVSTFAGNGGGYVDGVGTAVKFNNPRGVCSSSAGNLLVTDNNNGVVRKITPSGLQ